MPDGCIPSVKVVREYEGKRKREREKEGGEECLATRDLEKGDDNV